MLIVRVELHSAITGKRTEIARMHICNRGGTETRGDYGCTALRGRSARDFDVFMAQRRGRIENYPRLAVHVWNLVAHALKAMNYGDQPEVQARRDHRDDIERDTAA